MQNIFIDRDGVILKNIFYDDTGQFEGPRYSKDIEFKSYSIEALKILQKFSNIFLISNQPNASKEKTKIKYIYETNLKFEKILRQNKIYQECNLGISCGILIIGKGQSLVYHIQPLKKGVGYE